jgi:hypothetical protein
MPPELYTEYYECELCGQPAAVLFKENALHRARFSGQSLSESGVSTAAWAGAYSTRHAPVALTDS